MESPIWHQQLIEETKRRLFGEGIPRIRKCLQLLSEDEIWWRPNEKSNSAGNLVLHLCGNVRQWIIAGFGRAKDDRQRDIEFLTESQVAKKKLMELLTALEKDVAPVLDSLTSDELTAYHDVQVYRENGVSILVHVVEHFSYHVGQITYLTKALKDVDTRYYTEDLG